MCDNKVGSNGMPRNLFRAWRGWGFKEGKTKHRYMKDKKEEYLRRKKTKDIKRNGKKVLDGRR